ncbi:MAG TPA: tripartite tricarboxylate transporter substrate binding protein [Ottowia sp.]|uniref:Bug family tripartite tricarboxylate transporter substrate binding protein n=1 Tax=Ottowia sp. TaxID=1898956 RepID=UPI002C22C8B0|nr:tripartite tricarboxylate transporter substrate binding protein [Ottowia sp.]HOP90224.1 tripartite tricarboxylate transporter substrate binding protein [Ottowia sp.]HRM53313.1 tripartite tricarboxylate transporter substrate binding protein [Ottowia sp.]HRN06321.1 tripartite tricarboxylate transporter substrate binding protein [Ottowia sp.]
MSLSISRRHALIAASAACALPLAAHAQAAWPAKPVTLIVPFPAGGGTDAFARPLATQFSKLTGKALVIDNRGGAGGTLGASVAAKAPADGYTLFMGGAHHVVAPSMYPKLDYDIEKDFVPLIQLASVPQVLVVNSKRANTGSYKEFIELIRKNPGKLDYASAGAGSVHHLAGELFKQQTKTSITHIPYRGAGPALQDLIAGTVDMAFDGLGSSAGHIKGGRIKALMVAGNKRNPAIPDVPSAAEVGLPAYDVHTWYGLWAPKGTPPEVQAAAIEAFRKAAQDPEAKTVWAGQGADFPNVTGAQFGKLIHDEIRKWADVVKASGAKLE